MAELRGELRQDMADLRHSFELKLASTVTHPHLYGAILGQMALLLGIAYVTRQVQLARVCNRRRVLAYGFVRIITVSSM